MLAFKNDIKKRHIHALHLTAMALTNKSVIDKLIESGIPETIDYLENLAQSHSRNVSSLGSCLRRLQDKNQNLHKSVGRFKGKKALDSFLAEPFSFPEFDRKKQVARFVKKFRCTKIKRLC